MPGESRGMRPLSLSERGMTTIYGMIPASLAYLLLRVAFLLVHIARNGVGGATFWEVFRYAIGLSGPSSIEVAVIEHNVPQMMGNGMYAVFYFTYGRSLGHMLANAHIVDAATGRRMRTWQKALRAALQIANMYSDLVRILDWLSVTLVVLDRGRRRSLYDLLARTVVVVGDPVEDEPAPARQRSRIPALFGRARGQQGAGRG